MDTLLFPLDTLKTRLQSAQGFKAAGGFNGVYRGLSSAISGSAPSAAAFFMTYETLKIRLRREDSLSLPAIHMMAASGGEITACIVRVPTEVVKQRLQTGLYGASLAKALSSIWKAEGIFGYYRGYGMTLFREVYLRWSVLACKQPDTDCRFHSRVFSFHCTNSSSLKVE